MTIRTIAQLIEMLTAQKNNLGAYFTQCNANAADVTAITNELNNLTAMQTFAPLTDDYKQTIFEVKQTLFDGPIGTPISPFPPALVPPTLVAAAAGSLHLSRIRNNRFKAGPGYTQQIGEAIGIASDPNIDPAPTDVQPTVNVFAAQIGYVYSVVVSNRVESDRWEVLVQPVGSSTWTVVGSATGKAQDFTYVPSPGEAGKPVQIRVMVQLKKSNANYGNPSQQVMITVNP